LLLAVASALLIKLLFVGAQASGGFGAGAMSVITPVVLFLKIMMSVNVILAVFNMLPIPPLDGSHILATLLSLVSPSLMEAYESLRPYGWLILIAASFTGIASKICAPIYSLVMSGLNAWL
jgi:Zn-dependent protease